MANVAKLIPAWTFHTGALDRKRPGTANSSFEATPILFHGALYVSSPFDDVFALDPATGKALWSFDARLPDVSNVGVLTSRGVAAWPLPQDAAALPPSALPCAARIFLGTMDARLLALDAATGKPCADFGHQGAVDLRQNVDYRVGDPYFITSPPTVVGNVVIVGSGIGDNLRVDINSGLVRGFDVRSGRQVWQWEPLPWAQQQKLRTGAGNAWSVIAADPDHDLIFVPTGAPSPDFYGGQRPGDNRDANSVVALEASTGRRVWGFQVVHHDLWDYDIASEPLLFTFRGNVPAIAITTKQGLVFLLNRLTGEPLFPVLEKPVPHSDVIGENASPTQPFQQIDSLSPLALPADAPLGITSEEDADCRSQMARLRYEGIYTPPSLGGTLEFPGSLGGVNWGSASVDPVTNTLYANTNRYAFSVTLVPHSFAFEAYKREVTQLLIWISVPSVITVSLLLLTALRLKKHSLLRNVCVTAVLFVVASATIAYFVFRPTVPPAFDPKMHHDDPLGIAGPGPARSVEHFGREFSTLEGTPYFVRRRPLLAASGSPCTAAPFGAVVAMNLDAGRVSWQTPLGTLTSGGHTGTISLGGDLVTGSGMVFTAASTEPELRAFDAASGRQVFETALPVPAQSTPMSYVWHGRQYIVIAAGGHGGFGTPIGDSLIAYALPAR